MAIVQKLGNIKEVSRKISCAEKKRTLSVLGETWFKNGFSFTDAATPTLLGHHPGIQTTPPPHILLLLFFLDTQFRNDWANLLTSAPGAKNSLEACYRHARENPRNRKSPSSLRQLHFRQLQLESAFARHRTVCRLSGILDSWRVTQTVLAQGCSLGPLVEWFRFWLTPPPFCGITWRWRL